MMGWVAVLAACQAGAAQPPLRITDALADCGAIADSARRLACFDELAAPYLAPGQVSPASPVRPASPARADSPPSPARSAEPAATSAPQSGAISARVASQRALPPDSFLVELDNGQRWRHEDVRQAEFLKAGDAVTITRSTLGTWRLTRDAGDAKNWIRVTRVR